MITKSDSNGKKTQVQMISLDQLVPQDHLLRKIDRYVDFDFIYDLVEEKYSAKTGRPGIDPVVLIKIPVIQYMYGIKSMGRPLKKSKSMWLTAGSLDWTSMTRCRISVHSERITKEDLKARMCLSRYSGKYYFSA